jgi:hypothetical protein
MTIPTGYAGTTYNCATCGTEVDLRGRRTNTQRIKSSSSAAAPWEEPVARQGTGTYMAAPTPTYSAPPKRAARPLVIIVVAVVAFVVLGFLALPLLRAPGISNEKVSSWQEYPSAPGQYTVRMPAPPQDKTQTTLAGTRPLQLYIKEVFYEKRSFGVAYFDLGDGDPNQYTYDYQTGLNAMAKAQGAQVISSGATTVGGKPGFMGKLKNKVPGFLNQAQFVRHGNRVYVIQIEAYIEADQPVVDAFMSSFRITAP